MKALKNWIKSAVAGIVREVVAESKKPEVDLQVLAEYVVERGLDYRAIAANVDLSDMAQEFDTDDIAREIARCQTISEDDVIEKIAEDYEVDMDTLADKIAEDFDMDYDRLAKALLRTISKSALV